MNEKISDTKDQSEVLLRAQKLLEYGEYREFKKLIKDTEENGSLTPTDQNEWLILRCHYYERLGRYREAAKVAEKAYKESQRLQNQKQSVFALIHLARDFLLIGNLEEGFEMIKICKNLIKTLEAKPEEIKRFSARLGMLEGLFYWHTGDIQQSLQIDEEALSLAQEIGDKRLICNVYNNLAVGYRFFGDLDRALEYAERAYEIHRTYFNFKNVFPLNFLLTTLIDIYIDKNDLENAQVKLQHLEQISRQEDNALFDQFYRGQKANILKSNPRARNRVIAEDLFRQLINEEIINFEVWVTSLINLCDFLLEELRMTNLVEIVNEIKPLIRQLLETAEEENVNWLVVEAYILEAKLSLLTFDIKQAKRYLTQARQIAERYGLNQLAMKVSAEYNDLLRKLDLWENLKENEAPMSDRLELTQLNEQIEGLIKNYNLLTSHIKEEKVIISKETKICLVCKGEVFGFSYLCKCGANYCENCARAVSDLENVCWVCESPIDYLKPIKPLKGKIKSLEDNKEKIIKEK